MRQAPISSSTHEQQTNTFTFPKPSNFFRAIQNLVYFGPNSVGGSAALDVICKDQHKALQFARTMIAAAQGGKTLLPPTSDHTPRSYETTPLKTEDCNMVASAIFARIMTNGSRSIKLHEPRGNRFHLLHRDSPRQSWQSGAIRLPKVTR